MAIYGIGAYFGEDVTDTFVKKGVAVVAWSPEEAPSLHNILRQIKIGDIMYIKTEPKNFLTIKAVGIVTDNKLTRKTILEEKCVGVKVQWIYTGPHLKVGKVGDKYNVRTNTLYEEYSPVVKKEVLRLLTGKLREP